MRTEVVNNVPNLVNNKMYDYGIGLDDHNRLSAEENAPISIISSNQLNNNNNINRGSANSVSNRLYYSDSFRLQRAKVINST